MTNTTNDIKALDPYMKYWLFVQANLGKDSKPKKGNFIANIREKIHRADFTDQSYRILSTWEAKGLIDSERHDSKQWRQFSALDMVWLEIISRLRALGLAIPYIEVTKQSLFFEESRRESYTLDFAIWQVLKEQKFIILYVFPDGKAFLREQLEMILDPNYDPKKDHIFINLSEIVKEIFNRPGLEIEYDNLQVLSTEESMLLKSVRNGEYNSIEVIMNDGKIQRIESSEQVDLKNNPDDVLEQVKKILSQHNYQNINLIQKDGKVSSLKRTILKKP